MGLSVCRNQRLCRQTFAMERNGHPQGALVSKTKKGSHLEFSFFYGYHPPYTTFEKKIKPLVSG